MKGNETEYYGERESAENNEMRRQTSNEVLMNIIHFPAAGCISPSGGTVLISMTSIKSDLSIHLKFLSCVTTKLGVYIPYSSY